MSILEAVESINWTLDRSPKTYETCRDMLLMLKYRLDKEELKQLEKEKQNDIRNQKG